jgi:FHA domain.
MMEPSSPIRGSVTLLGRRDPAAPVEDREAISLSDEYRSVTRVSHPHARIVEIQGEYYIEDRGSTGGNLRKMEKKLLEGERMVLRDGTLIDLAKGPQSATLLCVLPERSPRQEHPA